MQPDSRMLSSPASNDLDETLISSLKPAGRSHQLLGCRHQPDHFKDCPSFGGVYKLAAIQDKATGEFIPKIKLSENAEEDHQSGQQDYSPYL